MSSSPQVHPVHVPWGSQTGPRCWPLWRWGDPCAGPAVAAFWAPAEPRRPRGARGAARGRPRPQPRPSAWWRMVPDLRGGSALHAGGPARAHGDAQPALRVPARRHSPGGRGRLAAADACLRGMGQARWLDGQHDRQSEPTDGSDGARDALLAPGRCRPPLASAVPSPTAPPPNKPSPPPRSWRTLRGRVHMGNPSAGSQAGPGAWTGAGTPTPLTSASVLVPRSK